MQFKLFIVGLILLGSIPAALVMGQPPQEERRVFDETKALAAKGDPEAQFALAGLYAAGNGVKRDFRRAADWYRKAADKGLARAQLALALDYLHGDGVDEDQTQGTYWLRKAADQGLTQAQLELGYCYSKGMGVDENAVEAANWYRKASDEGHPEGEYRLGECYLRGTGVAKDTSVGINLIRKAALQGLGRAQAALGMCYEKGEGLEQNYVEAYKWLNLAAGKSGQESWDAKVELAKVEPHLTEAQVAEAQKWDREFTPSKSSPPAVQGSGPGGALGDSRTGAVMVTAADNSCEIFVDGAFVGNSPAKLKLIPGKHVIEVRKRGFKPYRREITVGAGAELSLRPELENE